MEFTCGDSNAFIEALYDFFISENICFLSGAIVIDDERNNLFDSLYRGVPGVVECHNIHKKRRPLGTHMAFISNEKFQAYRKDMSNAYAIKNRVLARQYEKVLDPPLEYLCDKQCRSNPKNCTSEEREAKRVMLFYPFTIENILGHTSQMPLHVKYVYMKLEGYVSSDPRHSRQAIKRYILGQEKRNPFEKRREDDKKTVAGLSKRDRDVMIEYYVRNGGDVTGAGKIYDKCVFYDTHVRTRNEVYIPSEIVDIILENSKRVGTMPRILFSGTTYQNSPEPMQISDMGTPDTASPVPFAQPVSRWRKVPPISAPVIGSSRDEPERRSSTVYAFESGARSYQTAEM